MRRSLEDARRRAAGRLLSTSLVAHMTAYRVEVDQMPRNGDLDGRRLAAVADRSGAEYLEEALRSIPNTRTFARRSFAGQWQV